MWHAWENKKAYMGLVGKPGEKIPLEKIVSNIKTDLSVIGCYRHFRFKS